MPTEYPSADETNIVTLPINTTDEANAYWTEGDVTFTQVKFVRTGGSAPWKDLVMLGVSNEDQYWMFLTDDDSLVAPSSVDPQDNPRWRVAQIAWPNGHIPVEVQFHWPGVDFTIVTAQTVSAPNMDALKAVLVPPPCVIYLVDASGSMAGHLLDIASTQLGQMGDWAAFTGTSCLCGIMILKHGGFTSFPTNWIPGSGLTSEHIVAAQNFIAALQPGNSPLGALVKHAQDALDIAQFTTPTNIGYGALIFITDGKENGDRSPKIPLTGAEVLESHPLHAWLSRTGYQFIVAHYDDLPFDIWHDWSDQYIDQTIGSP